VTAVVLVVFIVMAGAGLVLPVLPLFARSFGVGYGAVGLLVSAYGLARLVFDLAAGPIVDRFGERAAAVGGLAVVGLVPSPLLLGVVLAVLGVTSGAAGVPPGAMLSDVAPARASGTAVGVFRFGGDLGFTLGPLLAGWAIPVFGFRWAFALAAVPTLVALALILRTPETLRPAEVG
jgi:MFS family permease